MSQAVDLLIARLPKEEGEKLQPYDDATGQPVRAPKGNLSWGRGYNLMECGSPGLFDAIDNYLLGKLDQSLTAYPWYGRLDPLSQSVILDISYNGGLHGHPKMFAAIQAGDRAEAIRQCSVADQKLDASRYAPLRALLQTAPPWPPAV